MTATVDLRVIIVHRQTTMLVYNMNRIGPNTLRDAELPLTVLKNRQNARRSVGADPDTNETTSVQRRLDQRSLQVLVEESCGPLYRTPQTNLIEIE